MGKNSTKNLTNNSLYRVNSPWLLNETAKKSLQMGGFGFFSKSDDTEAYMDQEVSQIISQLEIERDRLHNIQKEDDSEEIEICISQKARDLNLLSSENQKLTVILSESDLQLENILRVPSGQQTPLLQLKDKVVSNKKAQHTLCASDPNVIKLYKKLGLQLSRYQTYKKLPKALRIIPSLTNWDEILLLTNPNKWTPQAIYDLTLIFIAKTSVRTIDFFKFVLLPLTRQNLLEKGILDQSILFALQKSIQTHAGFFMKGFMYPLCDSCTVQEAMILASLIAQTKMSKIAPGPAIMYLADRPMTLPVCILVLALFEKEMFITQRVTIFTASRYFIAHGNDPVLPLIWYQALLLFVKNAEDMLLPKDRKKIASIIERTPDKKLADELKSISKRWGDLSEYKENENSSDWTGYEDYQNAGKDMEGGAEGDDVEPFQEDDQSSLDDMIID